MLKYPLVYTLISIFCVFVVLLFPSCSKDDESPVTPKVNSIYIADVSNFGDGRDLEVTFSKVSNEELVNSYRIVIVKSLASSSFSLEIANNLTEDRFTEVPADNTNKKLMLTETAKDSDGAMITEGQSYNAFVLTVGKSGKNELSTVSNGLTLTLPDTPVVGILSINDFSNFGDGRDLKVAFNKVSDESLITEYRVIIVKSASVATFTLAMAEALVSTDYTVVSKTGTNKEVQFTQSTTDSNGDLIQQDNQYACFVLTIGTGRNSGQNKLSVASNVITVEIPSSPAVTNLSVVDVANNANAKDIELSFNKASNESMVSAYRAIVVKESSAGAFTLAMAESLPTSRYTSVNKTGNNINQELPASLVDSDGDPIQESVNYKLFILSVADGSLAGKNSLSPASASITLLRKNAVRTFASFPDAGTGGLQVDAAGNVYFGDFGINENTVGTVVYKITPDGVSSVFVSGMQTADGNDFDSQGNFYSISWRANQIIKVTPAGVRSVFASGAPINGPIGIAVDASDNLFVTCYNNNTVVKITPAGVATLFASSSLFNGPNGIDTDAAGNIYVSNWNDSNIMKVDKDNGNVTLFVSTPAGNNAHLVVKNDIIYVSGRSNHTIFKVTLSKVITSFVGTGVAGSMNGLMSSATISWPNDIAFNADGTKMYISTVSPTAGSGSVFGPVILREVSIVE